MLPFKILNATSWCYKCLVWQNIKATFRYLTCQNYVMKLEIDNAKCHCLKSWHLAFVKLTPGHVGQSKPVPLKFEVC